MGHVRVARAPLKDIRGVSIPMVCVVGLPLRVYG